jgi:cation diffusion facilitator family transporter
VESLAEGHRASTVSLALNGALSIVKLTVGIVGNSFALVADAIESIGDVLSSAIVLGGLTIAARPADETHPYGHGKAEPLAALAVAFLLVAAAAVIAYQAIQGIITPHSPPAWYTLVVLLGVVVLKEGMYQYESGAGRRIGSTAVEVDAWHHRSDALTSLAAGIGITVALIGGNDYAAADEWAALAACLIIGFNGVRFSSIAIHELMDPQAPDAVLESVVRSAGRVEGAWHVEKVLVRKMGPRLFVDLHLEVDPCATVQRGHQIAHSVKDAVMADLPAVADVLIHVEPGRPQATTPYGPEQA